MPATAVEQMILELINRARLDPAAEAARDGVDLNEGLAAGTISTASKQPLAMNETLLTISRAHDQDMIAHDYFDHTDSSGHDPFQRMLAAGYNYATAGENIAWSGTTGTLTTQMSLDLEAQLFVDSGVAGRGHRLNLLNGAFQEIGDGVENGAFMGYNATLITQDFGSTGAGQFLTGVSYNDTDHNNFYSIGEGRNGVSVAVSRGASTATAGAGGYSLAIGAGLQTVTFSGGGLASPVSVAVTIASGTNAKVDMVDQGTVTTSASLTDLGGAARIIGLGTFGLTLTGDDSSETFSGTTGDDTILGGGGNDSVIFSAARSAYTITTLASGSVQVAGPDGKDTLTSIEQLVFTDQTVNVSRPHVDDINGDGNSDIFWQNTNGAVAVYEQSGANIIGGGNLGNPGTSWRLIGTGDFNGDGDADLLWQNANSTLAIWEMQGAKIIGGGNLAAPGAGWNVVSAGDFNHDGKSDILLQNSNSGQMAIWEANGAIVLNAGSTIVPVNPGGSWRAITTGDFYGNGASDIAFQNANGDVAIWEMNGTSLIGGGDVGNPGSAWKLIGAGDFNADGRSDLLFQNTSGAVAIWDMNGDSVIGGGTVANPGAAWRALGAADYAGTGYANDILFQNTSGEAAIWEMANTTIVGGGSLGNPGASWTPAMAHA
jgi:hypothetical protein